MKRFLSVLFVYGNADYCSTGMYYAQGFGSQTVYAQEKKATVIYRKSITSLMEAIM